MQFQADTLCRPVLRSIDEELSAIGASWLAGLALGWWSSLAEISDLSHAVEEFIPVMDGTYRTPLFRLEGRCESCASDPEAIA